MRELVAAIHTDGRVDHVVVPHGFDMNIAKQSYTEWLQLERKHEGFADWLVARGAARKPTRDDLIQTAL